MSINITVAHSYNFTRSGAAKYDFHARNAFLVVNDDSSISTIYADSSAHAAHISGKLASPRPTITLGKRASYNGCSASQQTALVSAAAAAQSYAAAASSYASSKTASTTRYTTWFGTYTTSRHSTVVSQYSKISSNTFSSFTFDCTCTDSGTYAYVYPDTYDVWLHAHVCTRRLMAYLYSFGYIYLCGAFWDAPTTGTDSKVDCIYGHTQHSLLTWIICLGWNYYSRIFPLHFEWRYRR